MLAGAFVPVPPEWLVGAIVVIVLVPVVYSYFVYRRVEGFANGDGDDLEDGSL